MFNIFNYLKYSMIVDFMGTFLIQYDLFYFFVGIRYFSMFEILCRDILLHLAELRNIWHVCCNSRMNARDERIALEPDGC